MLCICFFVHLNALAEKPEGGAWLTAREKGWTTWRGKRRGKWKVRSFVDTKIRSRISYILKSKYLLNNADTGYNKSAQIQEKEF